MCVYIKRAPLNAINSKRVPTSLSLSHARAAHMALPSLRRVFGDAGRTADETVARLLELHRVYRRPPPSLSLSLPHRQKRKVARVVWWGWGRLWACLDAGSSRRPFDATTDQLPPLTDSSGGDRFQQAAIWLARPVVVLLRQRDPAGAATTRPGKLYTATSPTGPPQPCVYDPRTGRIADPASSGPSLARHSGVVLCVEVDSGEGEKESGGGAGRRYDILLPSTTTASKEGRRTRREAPTSSRGGRTGHLGRADLRRLARRGGVKRMRVAAVHAETEVVLRAYLRRVLHACVALVEHRRRRTVRLADVVQGLAHVGQTFYPAEEHER